MRYDPDYLEEPPVFTLTCPSGDTDDARIRAIFERGNLPLFVGDDVLAEISQSDLDESWVTALSLPAKDLNAMTRLAARRLSEVLEYNLDADDLTEIVSDAAVLFLLAMRRHGIADPKRIPPCVVKWNGQDSAESVLMLA
jgi:hypothetical protein